MLHLSQKVHQRERELVANPVQDAKELNYSNGNPHCQSPLGKIHKSLLCPYHVQGAVGAAINRFIGLLEANVPLGESDCQMGKC